MFVKFIYDWYCLIFGINVFGWIKLILFKIKNIGVLMFFSIFIIYLFFLFIFLFILIINIIVLILESVFLVIFIM